MQMSNAHQLETFYWVLFALALGGLVGLEREFRGHAAGIRTTALVCAGSALFAQVSGDLGDTRVAAGVVQGIGFLGAGIVFQRGESVTGVTTAATIWVMAAVGLVAGSHMWITALLSSATFVTLLELAPLSDCVLAHRRPDERMSPRGSQRLRGQSDVVIAPGHDDGPPSVE